jgi:hypothetical protein
MKNIYWILICLLLISCSSTNIEKEVVRDFINYKCINNLVPYKIMQNSIPKIKALERYEKAYMYRNTPLNVFDPKRAEVNGRRPYAWPIDSLEINNLKKTIKEDTIPAQWRDEDFIKSNYVIIKMDTLNYRINIKKYKGSSGLFISKPIISANKDYALIASKTSIALEYRYGIPDVFLLKRENKKWVVKNNYSWLFIYE